LIALVEYIDKEHVSIEKILYGLNCDFIKSEKEIDILRSDKIILSASGDISSIVKKLHKSNLFTMLRILIKPFLGIDLGMLLLCNEVLESNISCLSVLSGSAQKFDQAKVDRSHQGFNKINNLKKSILFEGITNQSSFYFSHSLYLPLSDYTIAESKFEIDFTAALNKVNYYGIQFKPEESGDAGIQVVKNFLELC